MRALGVLSDDEPELLHVAEELVTVLNGTALIWRCPTPPSTVIHTFRLKKSLWAAQVVHPWWSILWSFGWKSAWNFVLETTLHFTSYLVQHGFKSWHRSERTVSADWNGSDDLVTPSTSATWRSCVPPPPPINCFWGRLDTVSYRYVCMYVCNLTLGQGGGQSNLTISQIASLAALLASSGSTLWIMNKHSCTLISIDIFPFS